MEDFDKESNDELNEKTSNNLNNSMEKTNAEIMKTKISTIDTNLTKLSANVEKYKKNDSTLKECDSLHNEIELQEQKNDLDLSNTNFEKKTKELTDLEIDENSIDTRRNLRNRRTSPKKEFKEIKQKKLTIDKDKKRSWTTFEAEERDNNKIMSINGMDSRTPKLSFDSSETRPESNNIDAKFKFKDVRDAVFFDDYNLNELCVHIRIQPEERNDSKEAKYFCVHCGFESQSFYTNRNHQESCSHFKYSSASYINTNNHTLHLSPKPLYKIEKITFKPLDLDFSHLKTDSKIINFDDSLDFSDSDSENEDDLTETQSLEGYKEKDIVWVKSVEELGPWPALIIKILPYENKLSVKLIEYPLKRQRYEINYVNLVFIEFSFFLYLYSFKVDVKSVVSYNAGIRDKKIKWKNVDLTKACSKADEYVRKRTLNDETNDNINPEEFFKFTKRLMNKSPVNQSLNNDKDPEKSNGLGEKNNKPIQVDSLRISHFIKSEYVNSHINSIFLEKYKEYEENSDPLMRSNVFGPIKDEEQQEELVNHCTNCFKECMPSKPDNINFVLNVLVPQVFDFIVFTLYLFK